MHTITKLEKIFLCLLVILVLLNVFCPNIAQVQLAIIAVIIMILGFHHLGIAFKCATGIFFLLGLILVFANGFNLYKLADGVNSMTSLIALLIVMQLFTVPINIGNYQESIANLINSKLSSNKALFNFTMLVTFLLSSILSMGTVPIVYSILGSTLKERLGNNYHHFSSIAISRAFTLGTLWAPGAATIFLISTITKVPLQKIFLPSLVLGILGLVLSYLFSKNKPFMLSDLHTVKKQQTQNDSQDLWKVGQILIAIVILLTTAFTLIELKIGEAMTDVAIAGLAVVLVWILLLQKNSIAHNKTKTAFQNYYNKGIINGGSLASFFVAIGLFSHAFGQSPISKMIGNTISPFIASLSWDALILIPILVVALSIIGIHPLASVTLLGQILVGIHLPFSILAIALALNIGSVLAYMTSPFAGIVVVLVNIIHEKPMTVSLRWNGRYCIALLVLAVIFIIVYTSLV